MRIGEFVFFARSTGRPDEVRRGGANRRWLRWLGVAAVLHAIVLALFALVPPNVAALNSNNMRSQERYITMELPAPAQDTPELPATPASSSTGGSTSAAAGEAGGGESATPQEAGSPGESRPHGASNPRPAFVVTQQNVNRLGVLAVLSGQTMSWGDGASPFVVGSEVADGEGGLANAQQLMLPHGPGFGALNLDNAGVGTCDPRTQDCTQGLIGLRGFDTHGDPGTTVPGFSTERPGRVPPPVRPGPVSTRGGLSREQVRRTVRRHVNEVRSCYEQALVSRPDIEGRVAVRFIVTADGTVQGAGLATNDVSDRVGSCVQQAVTRWTFPTAASPTGVTYPFVMTASH